MLRDYLITNLKFERRYVLNINKKMENNKAKENKKNVNKPKNNVRKTSKKTTAKKTAVNKNVRRKKGLKNDKALVNNNSNKQTTNAKEEKQMVVKEENNFMFKKENLKIIPLGGIEEIGKNITVFEYGNDMIIVDCGVGFPEDDMLGIDLVIPDFSYLIKNKDRIKGLVVTHGHEDHIGSIAYLLKEINVPIYSTRLTIGLIKNRIY